MKDYHTRIATSDASSITIREKDLVNDLIGAKTFTEMVYFLHCGTMPDQRQARILDACLVTLMEHGFTPSALAARITADSVPEQIQVAIAAGLLSVGSVFVGTMEGCAALLSEGREHPEPARWAESVAADYFNSRKPIPGFGHPFHKPDDPRTPRLFAIAREADVGCAYVDLLETLSKAVDARAGKHLTINATGAIGALLLEIGIPPAIMRSIAVISRCGGLAGHIMEEHATHSARKIWSLAEENIPYRAGED